MRRILVGGSLHLFSLSLRCGLSNCLLRYSSFGLKLSVEYSIIGLT
uniref:Uncharacterized protein n=1 Tax=Meloidogyne enterolobii TaxID=390850 RepID=A0A6V7TIZ8_MELEN|nr:unnamed protein product [Meloidogyne enterolobii]